MNLTPGTSLGPYEIVATIGAGGMGEVYRARDTRLNRDVAIKVLAAHLAGDDAALARFEREAQAVAALSHPSILAIHDVGRHDGVAYAVMELLDGVTLRQRLADGPLPLRKTLDHAQHIASGLAAAHERGIVHRDLKPENIFLTSDGRVKILDFGLAQVTQPARTAGSQDQTVLGSAGAETGAGMILGTVGYMAPEQVRGQVVDARADIFALGAVLYESVSGRRAFSGDTAADTMSAILRNDPLELGSTTPAPPASLERIIRRCLEKEPAERFQSARDLAFALDAVGSDSSSLVGRSAVVEAPSAPAAQRRSGLLAAAGVGAAMLALGLVAGRATVGPGPGAGDARLVRFTIPALLGYPPAVAVSPDGNSIVWQALPSANAETGTRGNLFLRNLESEDIRAIPDSTGAVHPVFSPDNRRVAFMRDEEVVIWDIAGAVQRITVGGGPVTPLPSDVVRTGLSWDARGGLLVGLGSGIRLLDPARPSDQPRAVTSLEEDNVRASAQGVEPWTMHGVPRWLPDGRRFLYMAARSDGTRELRIGSADGGAPVTVATPGNITRMVVDPAGFLIYGQNGTLVAHPFDFDRGTFQGVPVTIAPDVDWSPSGWLAADVSPAGVLAYRAIGVTRVQFEWVDRVGRRQAVVGQPEPYTNFDLSPDGLRVVVVQRSRDANSTSIALLDIARDQVGQAVGEVSVSYSDPTFSPDGTRIAFRRGRQTVVAPVNGGEARVIRDWISYPDSWSRDGRYLAVGRPMGRNYEIWAIEVDGKEDIPLVQGLSLADEPRFSPDGRWVAFHAVERDVPQVFVMPFPPTGERWQLSAAGGVQPRWRADGRELFFLSQDGGLMSVAIPASGPRQAPRPTLLFGTGLTGSAAFDQFAPAPDGQRFLLRRPVGAQASDTAPVTVIVNWRSLPAMAAGK